MIGVNGQDLGLFTPNLKLYQFDANTLSLENLAGGIYKDFKLGTMTTHAHAADAVGAIFQSQKSRGTAVAPVIVTTGDILREDRAYGYDGANYLFMGASYFFSTGTIAATRVPTRWEVWIATDAAPSVLTKSLMLSGAVSAFGIHALEVNTGINNSAFGVSALQLNSSAKENSAFGYRALASDSTGNYNTAFGSSALSNCTSEKNSGFGHYAGAGIIAGSFNCAFGFDCLDQNNGSYNCVVGALALKNGGNNNCAFGYTSLYTMPVTGTGNVAIGYKSGFYETGDNKLFIDNASRASEADARVKALIYGIFAALTDNQVLTVNAKRFNLPCLPTYANNAAAIVGGLLAGDLYKVDAVIDPEPVYIVH